MSTPGDQLLPLVEQAGVDLPDELAEPLDEVAQILVLELFRDGLRCRAVGVGEVAQDHALGAGDLVVGDIFPERHGPLVHVAHDRLGVQFEVADPRLGGAERLERGRQQLVERLRIRDLLEQLHPLVVLDALRLHRGDRLTAGEELLLAEHGTRIVERGLDDRDHVERVGAGARAGGRIGIEQLERRESEWRQRLVECEVRLQVDREADVALRSLLDDAGFAEGAVDADGSKRELALPSPRLVVVVYQGAHIGEDVAATSDHVEHHGARDLHVRGQGLRHRVDELAERGFAPRDEAVWRLLAHDLALLFRVVAGLLHRSDVLALVLGRLGHDRAGGVVSRSSRTSAI